MGSIRRKRSPAVMLAMLGAAVAATTLLALDARGSDIPDSLSVATAEFRGLDNGAAPLPKLKSTATLASMPWNTYWPEPLVVLTLLVGYCVAVLAKGRLEPVRVRPRRP